MDMMNALHKPTIHLTLKPGFAKSGDASHLSVTYTVENPNVHNGGVLFTYDTLLGIVPAYPYTEADIHGFDDAGPLGLTFAKKEGSNVQEWLPERDTKGNVTLQMVAYPRKVDITTPIAGRVDLRTDRGGLIGSGSWFLPTYARQGILTHVLEWDLQKAPKDTRAVWSYGEGPGRIVREGLANTFIQTVFMVGQINSYPAGPRYGPLPGFCGCYWFGELIPNLDRLKQFNSDLFAPMSELFKDEQGSYRVFIRSTVKGWGGSGFLASYVLEYDEQSIHENDSDVMHLFGHEMVHSFAVLSENENDEDNGWYIEGLAQFYGTFLPYRYGLAPHSFIVKNINACLSSYYTNPWINIPMQEATEKFWSDWYAVDIPYNRGFAYLLVIDCYLRRRAGITDPKSLGPMDHIIVNLALRQKRGELIQRKHWLELIQPFFGNDFNTKKHLQGMLDGETIELKGLFALSKENAFVKTKQRRLQMGFDMQSVSKRIVSGVVKGSRAEKAGVRNGDHILKNSRGGFIYEHPEATYTLVVEREGKEITIEWLPREDEEVPCFQLEHASELQKGTKLR